MMLNLLKEDRSLDFVKSECQVALPVSRCLKLARTSFHRLAPTKDSEVGLLGILTPLRIIPIMLI